MEHTVFDTAKWFVEKSGGAIGSKRLQKLCYYAQAWSCAIRDKPLFEGDFEAWVHGPVNRQLWETFKSISYRDILSSDFSGLGVPETQPFSSEEDSFLERVWATYGQFSGYQLEELTHGEKPWLEQRIGLLPQEGSTNVIAATTMRDYYRDLYIQEANT